MSIAITRFWIADKTPTKRLLRFDGASLTSEAATMATRRVIKGVLANFLGAYTSRYSEYGGYWLFGFLVNDLDQIRIDLLPENVSASSDCPQDVAERLAVERFSDQLQKAGLANSQVQQACLSIHRLPGLIEGRTYGHPCSGFNLSFLAGATMDDGRRYERERVVFVAPHNPDVEFRSSRVS